MYLAVKLPFLVELDAWILILVLFVLMIISISLGGFLAKHHRRQADYQENAANTTIDNTVFGLLAFLLAFTFGMSATRFDARRQAIINEANAIGTAILRADLYPDSDRVVMRQYFKGYLDAKVSFIKVGADLKRVDSSEEVMAYYSALLWQRAIAFSKKPNVSFVISTQMIPALNAMFDAASTTRNHEILHVPQSIVVMLFVVSVIAAFILGYISIGKGHFDWFIGIGFCVLISVVIFITLDLDRSRRGLIRLDAAWQSILSLEQQFEIE